MMGKHQRRFPTLPLLLTAMYAVAVSLSHGQTKGTPATPLTIPAPKNLPVAEGYLQGADAVRLFYRAVGKGGRTIVFVHGRLGLGFNSGGPDLEVVAAKGFRFIEFDQRGGGRSELVSDKEKLTIDWFVRDLEALRRHFKLKKLNLVALDLGASIIARYAEAYPGNVGRIVLLSPMPPSEEFQQQKAERLRSLLSSEDQAARARLAKKVYEAADADAAALCRRYFAFTHSTYVVNPANLSRARGDICGYEPRAIRNDWVVGDVLRASLGHFNFMPLLAKIYAPTLVIEGAKTNVPLDATEAWARWLPNSRLLLIPDAGHENWLDQPEAVTTAISDFFQGRMNKNAKQLYVQVKSSALTH
jgi:proline iminopeptidase